MLGGRRFRIMNFDRRTSAHDHYLMRLIRQTGLDKVMPMDQEREQDSAYLVRLQTALIDSGRAHELVGAYILPEGVTETDWTKDMALATAKHIAKCNTEEDRTAINALAMDCVWGFFKHGLEQLKALAISLSAATSPTKSPVATVVESTLH